MSRRRLLLVALLAALIIGGLAGISVQGGSSAPAAAAPPPVGTATLARTDLQSTTLTAGTLGYAATAPVVNQLNGTYTELPPAGVTIEPGQALYTIDDTPVFLMRGRTPAWRAFTFGMSDGPDVRELQANLIALHDAGGLFTIPDGHYGGLTELAVERWQYAHHELVTGALAFGDVVFMPAAVRVGPASAAVGQTATPGQSPYQATSSTPTVTVPANATLPPTHVGERVSIILPSGASTPGAVTQIISTASGSRISILPSHPVSASTGAGTAVQVSLTTNAAHGVLAAPIAALLALAGGGFGVEVVEPSGAHQLVGVRTGLFSASHVQVSGAGITAGTKVVVAQ